MLTKDQILIADDVKCVELYVPEWGGNVRLRTITGAERDRLEVRVSGDKTGNNIRAALCALCICDEKNSRMFSDAEVERLGQKSASALDRIFQAARTLNGFTDSDIQELEKN